MRQLLLEASGPLDPRTEALLMLAARAEHVAQVMAPALAAGKSVVCDRFDGSTLAYQAWGRGLDPDELRSLSSWAAAGTAPDLVVLLQVPAQEVVRRLVARGGTDRFEAAGAAFHARVAEGFGALAAAQPGLWAVVDGCGSEAEVAERVWSAVEERLELPKGPD